MSKILFRFLSFVTIFAISFSQANPTFSAAPTPSNSPLNIAACRPGTGWTWTNGPAQPKIAQQATLALKGKGIQATVNAIDFGERDSCGNFALSSTDFSVTLKNTIMSSSDVQKQGLANQILALLPHNTSPLGNVQINFGPGDTKFYSNKKSVPVNIPNIVTKPSLSLNQNPVQTKKVYLLVYNPVLSNGQDFNSYMGWTPYTTLVQGIIDSFQTASNGQLQYAITYTHVVTDQWPIKKDGFRYTEAQYLADYQNRTPHQPDEVNYNIIIDNPSFDICGRLNRGEIDELWIYGGPYDGFYESTLVGPGAYWYNSPPIVGTHNCNKLLPIMGLNYERGIAEALHSFGHRAESSMVKVYGDWQQNSTDHNWDRFGLVKAKSPNYDYSGCGNIHYPPNGIIDYDYANNNPVLTNCEDFKNYPDLASNPLTVTQPVTCSEWGCDQLGYLMYWYSHLPSYSDCTYDHVSGNWWDYFIDPNAALSPLSNVCGPATSKWPVYRQDMLHTGRSSLTGPANPAVIWSYDAGSYDGSSPVIAPDSTIYVGLNNKLYAFDPNGGVKWSYAAGGPVKSPALAADGTIYAASADGKLYALNSNGSLKWAFATGDWINASPAISPDGVVYIGSADGKFYAIQPDGTLKWTYTIGSWQNPSPALGLDHTIYQGSTTSDIYALTPTGQLKWQYHTNSYVDATPALGTDGTLYIGSWDHSLYAINSNGTLKWSYLTDGAVDTVAIGTDGTLYAGNQDKYIYAINSNGTLKWRYLTDGVTSTPSIDGNGMVYVGSQDGYLYALNPSGSLKWRLFLGDWPTGSPVISSNQMLYATFNGKIYAIGPRYTFQSIGAQDGWLLESSETSGVGGSLNSSATTFRLGDDASKKQYRSILSFSTAAIPDTAVITAVTLRVKKSVVVGGGDPLSIFQGFFADVKTGFFKASTLQTSDFQTAASKTVGPTSPVLTNGWYAINLTSAKSFINKLTTNSGLTQIRLRFKLDDNNNAIANYLSLYSGNAPADSRPQLVITYYVP